jgi:hypothetical protein
VVLALLRIIAYPVNALDGATDANQTISGRGAGGDVDALRLLSLRSCLSAGGHIVDHVESRIPPG